MKGKLHAHILLCRGRTCLQQLFLYENVYPPAHPTCGDIGLGPISDVSLCRYQLYSMLYAHSGLHLHGTHSVVILHCKQVSEKRGENAGASDWS